MTRRSSRLPTAKLPRAHTTKGMQEILDEIDGKRAAPLSEFQLTREHDWFMPDFIGYECCRKCGIVRRSNGKNNPCPGIVRVALR
jgi:hypothetical protein